MEVTWHQAECSNSDYPFASGKMQDVFKRAYAYIVPAKGQLIICQVEELEEAIVVSGISE
jgi:hypothetical protein